MLYESYLGEEIKSDASQFLNDWLTRLKSWGLEKSLNGGASLLKLWAQGLRDHISAGRSNFMSSSAVNVASIASNAQAFMTALSQTYPLDDTTKTKYATAINSINDSIASISASITELNSFDPSIGDRQWNYYKERDAAIARGDLDNPIVGKDLKAQIISQAQDPSSNLVPAIRETVLSKYIAPSQPQQPSTSPAAPVVDSTGSAIDPATQQIVTTNTSVPEKKKIDTKTLVFGALAAYVAYKSLT